jgi:hypothetical protein
MICRGIVIFDDYEFIRGVKEGKIDLVLGCLNSGNYDVNKAYTV